MTWRRQVAFWFAVLAAFIAFVWALGEILMPFIVGMVLAYLFDPIVGRLQRAGLRREFGALLIIVLAALVFVLAILLIVPLLGTQIAAFINDLPEYVKKLQDFVTDPNRAWINRAVGERLPDAGKSLSGLMSQGAGWLAAFLASLWSGGKALVSVLSLLVITPVVTFYLLVDWDRMVTALDNWIPRPHRETVRMLVRDIDRVIAGFMRGQATCCLILATFYCVALIAIGLKFGLLIGLGAGVLSFVPYVGSITGILVGTGIAIAQFWPEWTWPLCVAGVFVVGQAVEGNVLQPNLVGKSIGLHPVWLMFSLLAFGYLFGFVGLLIAVPVAAAIGVLIRFALTQYLSSPLYTGDG
ncbi:MAG: AI-2E family transporter [Pseudorhodoplanes sp.]